MADEYSTKRIINLPAESGPAEGDVFVIDNENTGTKKLPVTGLIDSTLTQSRQAADAKAVGDEVSELKAEFTNANETTEKTYELIKNQSVRANGEINPSVSGYSRTDYISLERIIKLKTSVALSNCGFFDANYQSVNPFSTSADVWIEVFPTGAKYVVFSALTATITECTFTINKDTYAKAASEELEEIKSNVSASFCKKTAEASIVTIEDGANDVLVSSAKMHFDLLQYGTGDPSPSNVREFVLHNTIDIFKAKKNLYSGTILHGYYDGNANYTADERYRSLNISRLPAGTYTFSTDLEDCVIKRFIVNTSVTWVNTETNHYTFVLAEASRVRFTVCNASTETITATVNFQIEIGTTNTGIEQAEIETVSVTTNSDGADFCEGDVELNYVEGLYTAKTSISIVTITSDMVYAVGTSSAGIKYAELRNTAIDGILDFGKITDIKSNMYLYSESAPQASGYIRRNPNNTQWYIFDNRFTDVDTAKSLIDSTPVKIAVPLAEDLEKNVYAGNLSTYKGINNIWVDYSDIELTYKADTSLYIAEEFKKHLRIMVFGHSYSADCWSYVPFVLKNYGITSEIYLYYRGNCSIDRLVAEWNETSESGYDDLGQPHIRRYCHIDTRVSNRWDERYGLQGYSAKMVLEMAAADGSLDLITLQTAPTEVYFVSDRTSPDPRKGCEPYIRQAIDLINDSYHGTYTLGWFSSYTRIAPYNGTTGTYTGQITGDEFDNRIDCLRAAESICKIEPFEVVIPAAAAIFNARTNAGLASTDVSDIGNLWYSDAVHLQAGIPMYIGSLSVVQSIFNKFFPGYSVLGDKTRIPDNDWMEERRCLMPSIHGDVISTSEDLYELAQKCAVSACEHQFDITPIYSVNDSTQLQFQDTLERYWADALIDTSNIDNGNLTEQAPEA